MVLLIMLGYSRAYMQPGAAVSEFNVPLHWPLLILGREGS